MALVKEDIKKGKPASFVKKSVEVPSFQIKIEKATELLGRAKMIKKQSGTAE